MEPKSFIGDFPHFLNVIYKENTSITVIDDY